MSWRLTIRLQSLSSTNTSRRARFTKIHACATRMAMRRPRKMTARWMERRRRRRPKSPSQTSIPRHHKLVTLITEKSSNKWPKGLRMITYQWTITTFIYSRGLNNPWLILKAPKVNRNSTWLKLKIVMWPYEIGRSRSRYQPTRTALRSPPSELKTPLGSPWTAKKSR